MGLEVLLGLMPMEGEVIEELKDLKTGLGNEATVLPVGSRDVGGTGQDGV